MIPRRNSCWVSTNPVASSRGLSSGCSNAGADVRFWGLFGALLMAAAHASIFLDEAITARSF